MIWPVMYGASFARNNAVRRDILRRAVAFECRLIDDFALQVLVHDRPPARARAPAQCR